MSFAPTAAFRPRAGTVFVAVGDVQLDLTVADALALAGELIAAVRSPYLAAELLEQAIASPELRFPHQLEPRA